MSVYNLPTNFTNLIEPRTLECVIATPYGDTKVAYGNSGTVPSGYTTQASAGYNSLPAVSYNSFIGAGSIIKGVSLMNPTQGNYAAGGFTYTISLTGASASLTGDIVSFQGFSTKTPLALYGSVVQQNSSLLVSLTNSSTVQYQLPPNVIVDYLN